MPCYVGLTGKKEEGFTFNNSNEICLCFGCWNNDLLINYSSKWVGRGENILLQPVFYCQLHSTISVYSLASPARSHFLVRLYPSSYFCFFVSYSLECFCIPISSPNSSSLSQPPLCLTHLCDKYKSPLSFYRIDLFLTLWESFFLSFPVSHRAASSDMRPFTSSSLYFHYHVKIKPNIQVLQRVNPSHGRQARWQKIRSQGHTEESRHLLSL